MNTVHCSFIKEFDITDEIMKIEHEYPSEKKINKLDENKEKIVKNILKNINPYLYKYTSVILDQEKFIQLSPQINTLENIKKLIDNKFQIKYMCIQFNLKSIFEEPHKIDIEKLYCDPYLEIKNICHSLCLKNSFMKLIAKFIESLDKYFPKKFITIDSVKVRNMLCKKIDDGFIDTMNVQISIEDFCKSLTY